MHRHRLPVSLALLATLAAACSGEEPTAPQEIPSFAVREGPVFPSPADPLADGAVESCSLYQQTRCSEQEQQRCAIYDAKKGTFDPAPDPLLERVYLYERWYELHHSPDGQTADRRFQESIPHDASEAWWGDPARFASWNGIGDSALWTGFALNGAMMRYLVTGTEADYQRFEQKARVMLRKFAVTEIPGYLARYFGVAMPQGSPPNDQHAMPPYFNDDPTTWSHRLHPIDDPKAKGLPDAYEGSVGLPFWEGQPSIDSYSGVMTTFAAAWGLLRDPQMKAQITEAMTCYLKRLQRLEIINLSSSSAGPELVRNLFSNGTLALDPGDYSIEGLDRIVIYYLGQTNQLNNETFDFGCPASVTRTPDRIIDSLSDTFELDMFTLVGDLNADFTERKNGIDHMYAVNVSGADAVHLLNLASISYYLTGEQHYLDFLQEELVDALQAPAVAATLGALQLPKWCGTWYGDHRSLNPLWALINLLGESDLRAQMRDVMQTEGWEKSAATLRNAKLSLLYGATAPSGFEDQAGLAVAEAVATLESLGGNGGTLRAPRRTYTRTYQEVIDAMPEGTTPVCPTEQERAQCEDGFELFGIRVPGDPITFDCTGDPNECPVGDKCARPMASYGLPTHLREPSDYLWQRNPYEFGKPRADAGQEQSPGLDLIEPYWMARYYGFIDTPPRVLAWENIGTCP